MRSPSWLYRALPFVVSAALLGIIIWWVSPHALLQAAEQLRWKLLIPATVVMVIALYLWDAFCLPAAYSLDDRRWTYWRSLHVRGLSYLAGALNYELGQAGIAWGMARLQKVSLLQMLARSVLLAYHDALVLLAAGLAGAMLTNDPRIERIRPFIAGALALVVAVGVVLYLLPRGLRARIQSGNLEVLFAGWTLRRTVKLLPLRLGYFAILVVYAAIALSICGIRVDHEVVLSAIPLVLLAEGLPNFAGLGTRETSLQLLLTPPDPAVLLAMSLVWSTGMLLVRFVIGLVHVCIQYAWIARRESA